MKSPLKRLSYLPRARYPLDLEAFTIADWRRRAGDGVQATHQYEFYTLVCVCQGTCTHLVDFEPIPCAPGSLLMVRPGQAHNFGRGDDWEGWIVLFRPEFVLPVSRTTQSLELAIDLERLRGHLALPDDEIPNVTRLIEQMGADAKLDAPLEDLNALLRHQLNALLMRLIILQGGQHAPEPVASPALQRFKRFQQLVEEHFPQWHSVAEYADQLGCTEKSLTRAVAASLGATAKVFISARIALEAKRLLLHTELPVATIAEQLGFDEATNFSKFFKREVGSTPAAFRRQQRVA